MSKMTKRLLALFLAVLMFSGNAMGVLAEVVPETEPAAEAGKTAETTAGAPDTYELDPATLHVKKLGETDEEPEEEAEEPAPEFGPNDLVRVSIVLDQPSTLDMGYATSSIGKGSSADAYRDSLKKQQQNVTNAINAKVSTPLDVKWNLTLTVNIISANVRYRDIPVIGSVAGVKDVFIENRYEPVEPSPEEPNTVSTSAGMTGATGAWAEGYTGAGTRIAIIDTGLHYEHQSFSAEALLYSLSQMEDAPALMTANDIPTSGLNGQGIYFNEKVPYGYNYVDGDTRITHVEDRQGEHGSHVAGIAAANRYVKIDGEYVDAASNVWAVGMAPDAQLLIMKVFGSGGGAYDSDYMAAIEDALVLQCDSVNLSLGSGNPGWTYSEGYQDVMNKLTNSEFNTKTVVTISAGNSGANTDAMQTDLFIEDVNMHTGGSPGTFINSLCVASADNIGTIGAPLIFNGIQDVYYSETDSTGAKMATIPGTYDYVYIRCVGEAEDYAAVNAVESLSGKVVMVDRGEISFYEKGNNAISYSPKAVIVANNQAGTINMALDDYTGRFPMVCITLADAQQIIANSEKHTVGDYTYYTGTMEVSDVVAPAIVKERAEAEMSSFSSWGVPGSLIMKPEIVAPGGNIYSVWGYNTDQNGNVNGGADQYEFMSGTSMAAPHMTGLAAVMSQYVAETDPVSKNSGLANYSERAIKQSLLMSTATPMLDSNGDYVSILQQGAGLADVQKAVDARTVVFVGGDNLTTATGAAEDGKVKVEFGDDPDKKGGYTYTLTAYNLTDEDIEYDLYTDVFTQSLYRMRIYEDMDPYFFMDQATLSFEDLGIPFNVSYEFTNPNPVSHDVDMDGDTDDDDAQAILDYLTGSRRGDDLDLRSGDMDADGAVTSYDAYLLLKRGTNASDGFVVPASGSNTLTVTLILPTEISELEAYYPNGFYIEGFTYLSCKYDTPEGESILEEHSVPLLGYYGSWTDPSMFDNTSLTDLYYETYKLPYSGQFETNYMTVTQNGVTVPFLGNPYMVEEEFPSDKLAVNSRTVLGKIYYNLIRSAGTTGIAVSTVDKPNGDVTDVLAAAMTGVNEVSLYYYVNGATWYNTGTKSVTLGFKPADLGLSEGDLFRVGYYAIPEYNAMLMNEDITDEYAGMLEDNAAFEKLLKSNVLGLGAFVGYDLTVDDTAPELGTPEVNGDMLDISATDNLNLAYVAVLSLDGQTAYSEVAPGTDEYSDSIDIAQAIEEAEGYVALFAADYAGNEVAIAIRVNDNGGDIDPGAVTAVTLTPESLDIYKGNEVDLIANVIPVTAEDRTMTWISSDESVAIVDANGHVTAVSAGTATIMAASVSNPTAFATCEVKVSSVDKELNAIVWNAEGEVFFSKFNAAGLPEWNTLHSDPVGIYLHSTLAQNRNLFAADLDTSSLDSVFYQVNPSDWSVTELGSLGVGATSMAGAPTGYITYQNYNAFMQTYGYFVIMGLGNPNYLQYYITYVDMRDYIGDYYVAAIAAKSLDRYTGSYFVLDELGRIWELEFDNNDDTGFAEPKLFLDTGIDTTFVYQDLYCDGTYLYWTHTDTALNVAELIIIDLETKTLYHAGDFGNGVWPANGTFEAKNVSGATSTDENIQISKEPIESTAVPVTEEMRARYQAAFTKGNTSAATEQPAEPAAEEPAEPVAEEPVEEPAPEEEPVEEPAPEEEPVEEPAPEEEPVEEPAPEEEPVEEPAPEEEPVEEPAPEEEEPANPVTGGTDAAGTVKKAEKPAAAKEEKPVLAPAAKDEDPADEPKVVVPIGDDTDPSRYVFVLEADMTTNGLYEFTYDVDHVEGEMLETELRFTSFYDDGLGTIKFAFARDPKENEGEMPLMMVFEAKDCELETKVTAKTVELGDEFNYDEGVEVVTFIVGPHHVWGDVSYVWADDNSTVTATRTCQVNAEHVETETADVTAEITKPATCTEKGETTYTAEFENPAFETQTKVLEDIDALGHDFGEPVWTWAEDYSTAKATFTCSHDATHFYEFDCPVESEEQEDGSVIHTARVLFNGNVYTSTVTEPAPGLDIQSEDNSDGILLTWKEVSKAVGYNVYDAATQTLLGTVDATTFLDATTKDRPHLMGETYYFLVEAFDVHGNILITDDHEDMYNPFVDVEDDRPTFEYIAWAYNKDIVKGSLGDDGLRYFDPTGSTTRMNFVMILYKMHGSPKVSGKNPFKDVTGSKSVKAVLWAYNKGLVKGTDKKHFSPDMNLSRMNIVMILYKLAGSPKASGTNPYVDVTGSKSVKAVLWALQKGIMTGVDDTHFDPDGDCSRELFVEVLYKYNKIYKIMK